VFILRPLHFLKCFRTAPLVSLPQSRLYYRSSYPTTTHATNPLLLRLKNQFFIALKGFPGVSAGFTAFFRERAVFLF